MLGPRSAWRSIRAAAATATATLLLCSPATTTAALAASGPAAATPTSTALPSCDSSGLQATQDHVGTVAEVSSIDEMDTVTLTIQNSGATCSGLGAALYLQTLPNRVTLVWPQIFWRIDDGSWMAARVETLSCQPPPSGPTDSCIMAALPEFRRSSPAPPRWPSRSSSPRGTTRTTASPDRSLRMTTATI